MALDPNINRIKFLRSTTAGAVPAASLLQDGELAINLVDRTIYSKNGSNVVELGFGKGGSVKGNVAVTGTVSATSTITAPTFSGALSGNAATASKWLNARTITFNGDYATGSVSIDGTANTSVALNVKRISSNSYQINASTTPNDTLGGGSGLEVDFVRADEGWPSFGTVITAKGVSGGGGTLQLYTPYNDSYGGTGLRYRTGIHGTPLNWSDFKTLVDNNNIGDYAPTKTGGGASGTWGINISGNAATATTTTGNAATATRLQTARTINGVSFNGSANINIAAETPNNGTVNSDATLAAATTPGLYSVFGYTIAGLYKYGLLRVWTTGSVYNQMFISHNSSANGSVAIRQSWSGTTGYNGWRIIDSPNVGGNAATATALQTARTINGTSFNGTANITTANWGTARTLSFTGDATGSMSVNGSTNVSTALTLANSGVTAGTYKSVTVDAKGRVTAGATVITSLITSTSASGTSNVATTNSNTYLNIIENVGGSLSSVGSSSQVTGAGTVTVASDTSGKITITGSNTISGNAATATKLQSSRTFITNLGSTSSVSFNGSANVSMGVTGTLPIARGGTGGTTSATARTNLDVYSKSEVDAKAALPTGFIQWLPVERSKIEDGILAADGQLVNRADYPELWAKVNSGYCGKIVTDAVWLVSSGLNRSSYSSGNGSTTFRLPDLNGIQSNSIKSPVLRGDGYTTSGTVLSDAIRNITGRVTAGSNEQTSGAFVLSDVVWSTINGGGKASQWAYDFDASKVVPTSDENRPNSAFGIWLIVAKGKTENAPSSGSYPTLTGSNTWNGSQTIAGNLTVGSNATFNGTVSGNGLVTSDVGQRLKCKWIGAYIASRNNITLTRIGTTNEYNFTFVLSSSNTYIEPGSIIHFQVVNSMVDGTVVTVAPQATNSQTLVGKITFPLPSGYVNGNYAIWAITYEAINCKYDGFYSTIGDLKWVSKIKYNTSISTKFPIINATCVGNLYFTPADGTSSGDFIPRPGHGGVINAVPNRKEGIYFYVSDNNQDTSLMMADYVSITVYDN